VKGEAESMTHTFEIMRDMHDQKRLCLWRCERNYGTSRWGIKAALPVL